MQSKTPPQRVSSLYDVVVRTGDGGGSARLMYIGIMHRSDEWHNLLGWRHGVGGPECITYVRHGE